MRTPLKQQQGYTLLSLSFILGLIGFFVLLTLKIVPIYIDHSKVKSAFAALEETKDLETLSEHEVRVSLEKRFNLNYVEGIKAKDVKITKHGNYLKVVAEYEVVENIMGNLSVLVEFNDVIEVGKE